MMEFNDDFSRVEYKSESISALRVGLNHTRKELEEKCDDFKKYIENSKNYYKGLKINKIENKIYKQFYNKFDEAFNKWKKQLIKNGALSFYVGRILDALYLGLWDFDYVNDPYGQLSPFGPYLFQLLEIHRHRRIGILHALEQQQYHPDKKNLIGAQLLSDRIFKTFFSNRKSVDYLPVVQFSAGGPAAFFSTPYTPTIITLDKTKTKDIKNFSALPHECGHAILGTYLGRRLLESIKEKVQDLFKKRSIDLEKLYDGYWKWWIEECFCDAVAVAVLGEAEIVSLTDLFKESELDRIYRDSRFSRVDEHPNRFLRVLVAIQTAHVLEKKTFRRVCKIAWINYANKNQKGGKIKYIRDEYLLKSVPLKELALGIAPVVEAIVNTKYSQLKINNKHSSIKELFNSFNQNNQINKYIPSLTPSENAKTIEFFNNLENKIISGKNSVIDLTKKTSIQIKSIKLSKIN